SGGNRVFRRFAPAPRCCERIARRRRPRQWAPGQERKQGSWLELGMGWMHEWSMFRQSPAGSHEMAVVARGIALQIVLVLGLGLPERAGRRDLGGDLVGPQAGGVDVGNGV